MIEVFTTSIRTIEDAGLVTEALARLMPGIRIDFDLEDQDRIMRVHHPVTESTHILAVLHACGFTGSVLPD